MLTSRVTLLPNSQPAPRGLTAHEGTSSGSDHMRSIFKHAETASLAPSLCEKRTLRTAKCAFVRDLLGSGQNADLVERSDIR